MKPILIDLNAPEGFVVQDALNHYWHYVADKLQRNDLGDIERYNLELAKEHLAELLKAIR